MSFAICSGNLLKLAKLLYFVVSLILFRFSLLYFMHYVMHYITLLNKNKRRWNTNQIRKPPWYKMTRKLSWFDYQFLSWLSVCCDIYHEASSCLWSHNLACYVLQPRMYPRGMKKEMQKLNLTIWNVQVLDLFYVRNGFLLLWKFKCLSIIK